eukprot:Gb_40555 [translate_table: standard]
MECEIPAHSRPSLLTMQVPDCPVCWDRFDGSGHMPRLLGCGHTVCQLCLEYLPTETRLGQRCIRCPECRIPCIWRGVQELPKNYILLRALDSLLAANGGHSRPNLASSFLSDIQYLFPLPNFMWVDMLRSHRLLKQKVWELVKLTCIAGLVLLFVPVSLIHVLLAWLTAAIGFVVFLWLSAAGMGFCIFMFFVWCCFSIMSGVCRSHKFLLKRTTLLFKFVVSVFRGTPRNSIKSE